MRSTALGFWLVLSAVSAGASPFYQAQFLRPANGNVQPISFNDQGDIVGTMAVATGTLLFYYSNGVFTTTPFITGGADVNERGDAVLNASVLSNGVLTRFQPGPAIPADALINLSAINDSGTVAGSFTLPSQTGVQTAFAGASQNVQVIPSLGGLFTGVNDLNSQGEVVGASGLSGIGLPLHAFLYRNGVMLDLGTLTSDPSESSTALAINDNGQIVGVSGNLPFLYENGVMRSLELLPGAPAGAAHGINNAGDVVGILYYPRSESGFVVLDGVMYDLMSLVDPASGIVIDQAWDINNRGQILAAGHIDGMGSGVVILTPVPEPRTALFGALALLMCAAPTAERIRRARRRPEA